MANDSPVAVVGFGQWGKNLARNFFQLGALRAVCDADPAREEAVKAACPGVRFCTDYASLLADPSIPAVALSSPAALHYAMARQALHAGKDVYVEKPLSLKVAEAEELIRLAAESGRILMVGHILRHHTAVTRLQQLIAAGDLGRLQYLYSNRVNIGRIRTEENILFSFAPHDISVMLALLGEMPDQVTCAGGGYLHESVADVTMSQFVFPSGVRAHIFVSWLHPFKEQRLVVVGTQKMAVFDDTAPEKLVLYPHRVEWKNRAPQAVKAEAQPVAIEPGEPLAAECRHFLDCVASRRAPLTDGAEGLRVLKVLEACQRSLEAGGTAVSPATSAGRRYFVHESAYVDEGAQVGPGTKVWHFAHVMKGARVGSSCVIGQNVNVDGGAVVGNNVKIQNNVSVYSGIVVEDDVFLGPSCVLTNVSNPRSQVNRHALYETTTLRRGCTIGANATIVCGTTVGRYAFVAAGSVVTRDVPDYALMVGNPARRAGWMSRHGHRLGNPDEEGVMRCPESHFRYKEVTPGVLRCLDLDEEAPLPPDLAKGRFSYRELKDKLAQG